MKFALQAMWEYASLAVEACFDLARCASPARCLYTSSCRGEQQLIICWKCNFSPFLHGIHRLYRVMPESREVAEEGPTLVPLLEQWQGPLPRGLQLLALSQVCPAVLCENVLLILLFV